MKITKFLPHWISAKLVDLFMAYGSISTYTFILLWISTAEDRNYLEIAFNFKKIFPAVWRWQTLSEHKAFLFGF
jgi:hypothetical protein